MIRLPRIHLPIKLAFIPILALLLSGLTGCVSMDEHKRLQTAFDEARAQLARSENDLMEARKHNAELEAKIAELNRIIGLGGNDALRKERDLLAAQLADLQAKYGDLLKNAGSVALPAPINAALRDLAGQYPDLLEFDERLGMVRFKSDLTFDPGSVEVKPQAKEALAKFAAILNNDLIKNNEIQVMGHTDDIPIRAGGPTAQRSPTNWHLSTNRAWAVAAVLHGDGVAENRVMASGWGEQRPIAPNAAGHRGNEKNRRVDIYIRPTTVPEGIVVSTPGGPAPAPRAPRTPRTPTTPTPAPGTPATPGSEIPVPQG